ncbi:winged helix-turn-helix transcriptional regulator [Mammaliicoccus fleurettii]|nr:winged helix-turn-helix transcriptional regulator [Mammaliicoccus fleurettii]
MHSVNEDKVISNINQLGHNYGLIVLAKLSNVEREERDLFSELVSYDQQKIKQSLELLVENEFLQVRIEEIMPPNIYYSISEKGEQLSPFIKQLEQMK